MITTESIEWNGFIPYNMSYFNATSLKVITTESILDHMCSLSLSLSALRSSLFRFPAFPLFTFQFSLFTNISMHAFARLFTSDLIANDCRVFDWLGALNKNDEKHLCLLVMLTTSTTVIDSHFMSCSQTYRRQFWKTTQFD